MVLNPDPRPGRWLLPLVILGMMTFTYVFVQNLPGADAETQNLGTDGEPAVDESTTTTLEGASTTTSSTNAPTLSPEAQTYVDQVAAAEAALLAFQGEMADINTRWDADPKEIEFGDGESQLTDLSDRIAAWSTDLSAVVPPVALNTAHGVLLATAGVSADAAAAVLEGFTGPDAAPRITALGEFDTAVRSFTAAADDIDLQASTTGA